MKTPLVRTTHVLILVTGLTLAVALAACAGSSGGTNCDPATGSCACSGPEDCPGGWRCDGVRCVPEDDGGTDGGTDGGEDVTDGGTDADGDVVEVKLEFGEPCAERTECQSNICILVATGGFCSKACIDGSNCPDGFGCLGVLDAIEQGQIGYVCVPSGDNLCTACETSTECSLIGQDLCLNYGPGKNFCARDCRTVSCPLGYTCTDVTVQGNPYRQCVPDSGACDCGAANTGVTEPCELTTPYGPCGGTRTCGGAAGWGACLPPAPTDTPDALFADDDCDGIDGDLDGGIYVSTTGQDVDGCGLDHAGLAQPYCRTITYGIGQAFTAGLSYVYVQAGAYDEVVVLRPGVHVYGGYDATWRRAGRGQGAHTVTVTGGLDAGTGQYMTVRAHDLDVPTTVADLVLVGPAAAGTLPDGSGHSSYVVHASNAAGLQLERVTIQAGTGAPGSGGGAGLDAPTVSVAAGMSGGTGGAANESTSSCDDSSRGAAGPRGSNTCSGGLSPNGGAGGSGGTMDTRCDGIFNSNYNATSGNAGANADQWASSDYGYRGGGGYGATGDYTSGPGGPGNPGRVQNGAAGGGGAGAYLVGLYWYARTGGGGGLGEHGGGGGGGGGSGGSDWGIDSYGAGGGGGGAGGCAARGAGGGGGGGGGSFGVFAVASTVTLVDCVVVRGQGGAGGDGGTGGRGQSPGSGGGGGAANGDSAAGGGGGRGGHGGHGGGGGGGAGGSVYAFYTYGGTIVRSGTTVSSGGAGAGGGGGTSAPGAPAGENDGNTGTAGTSGGFGEEGACSSPSACQ